MEEITFLTEIGVVTIKVHKKVQHITDILLELVVPALAASGFSPEVIADAMLQVGSENA